MNRLISKRSALLLTVSCLIAASAIIAPSYSSAAATNSSSANINPIYQGSKLKSIYISNKSYIQIKDLEISSTGSDKYVYFTLSIYNGEKTSLDFSDYWVKVLNTSGAKFTPIINATDAKKKKISPNTTDTIRFSAKINANTNLSSLKFQIIKWDFSQANFEKLLGTIAVPANYSTTVPYAYSKVITPNETKLKSVVSSLQLVKIGTVTEASLTYNVQNIGTTSIKLPELSYYLKSSDGKYYKMEAETLVDSELAPNAKKNITLYAKLPTQKNNLTYQLYVSMMDAEGKVELPIGYYGTIIKADKYVTTAANAIKQIYLGQNLVNSKIQDSMIDGSGDTQNIYLTMSYENKGKEAVTLPSYQYSVMTSTGVVYPLKAEEFKDALLPNVSAALSLSGTVPSNVSTKGLKLIVQKPTEEKKNNNYLVSVYQIPEMSQNNVTANSTIHKNNDGSYEVKVNKLQRLPWQDNDLLNIQIEVTNKGLEDATVPNIKGYMILNGNKLDEKNIQLIKPANKLSLKPNETIKMIMTTNIPYNYEYSNVSVMLSNVISESSSSTIGRFSMTGNSYNYMPIINSNEAFNITDSGRQSQLNLLDYSMYEGEVTNLVYVNFDHTNQEARMNTLPRMAGYFIAQDGTYLPATFEYSKDKVSSTRTGLIAMWATVPKGVSLEDLKLYVGEAITSGNYTSVDGQPDGIINAKEYKLPERSNQVTTVLKDMIVRPYELDLSKVNASLSGYDQIDMEIEYTLEADSHYERVANGSHKIVFQMADGSRKYEKSFTIGGTENDSMSIGKDQKIMANFSEKNIINMMYNGYTFNIYDEFNGHRKLLVSKEIKSFTGLIPIN